MLTVFLAFMFMAQHSNAQLGQDFTLRIASYLNHTINGYAPPGSTIKLYYANYGSFTPNAPLPFRTVTTDMNSVWVYTRGTDDLGDFDGPVVVSMVRPGSTEEIFETATLGADEVKILNPRPCSETQTLHMFPPVGQEHIWRDRNGEIASRDQIFKDAPAGTYTLEYSNIAGRTYRSIPILVEGRPHPVSDEKTLQCGETFIEYTGQFNGPGATFYWQNEADGSMAGNTQKVKLYPGKYRFYVTSQSGCQSDPAIVIINAAPVLATINTLGKSIRNSDCGKTNGSISGIKVFPANNLNPGFRWRDNGGNTYNSIDLDKLPVGKYILEAFIPGCTMPLTEVDIIENNGITLNTELMIREPASCGKANGSITGLSPTNATSFEWYKDNDPAQLAGTTRELRGAGPGSYTLVLKNESGCFLSKDFKVDEGSPAIVLLKPPVIKDDECNLGRGSITGAVFNTTVSYNWKNEAGKTVGQGADLTDVPMGNYTLVVNTPGCEEPFPYTIGNTQADIPAPSAEDIQVCGAADINISFKESADQYRIYDAGGTLRAQSNKKDFRLRADQPGIYYAALASGTCESPRTAFNVSFGASGLKIPAAFSPNGDGLNDQWIIRGLSVYTSAELKIFNRQGVLVYHSRSQSLPFDGRHNGTELPVGVYYYILSASPECPAASGSLTLLR